ncbi:MAG TPA: hypothetical protein VGC36_07590, partial [Rhizomicrobium sp.]
MLASLAEIGQQLPIVVVAQGAGFVVIDGYKRVRALRRLARDRVRSTAWAVAEPEALLLDRMMRCAGENTLEQSWLLSELQQRFGLSLAELAQRFDRSKSWVCRRLALGVDLPQAIQEQVRAGAIAAHAAMKYLVPLARANAAAAIRLAGALVPLKPSTRQVGALYAGWQAGDARTRTLIETTPQIYLRAQAQAAATAAQPSPQRRLLDDLGCLAGLTRRVGRQLPGDWIAQLADDEREPAQRLLRAISAELHARFEGHLGRVHETLVGQGAVLSYAALTAFCRREGIGHCPKLPSGRYHFAPGQEMQHDTSPHRVLIGGVLTPVQTASRVLCYSRMIFFQCYPRFTRFECKAFLSAALVYFGGAAGACMTDNTHVIVAAGSGDGMIPAPEMAAFAERFGFRFIAHRIGDANRSARVEAPFARIERGFLTGQDFADFATLNQAARATCEDWNAKYSNKLHASRRELFALERSQLKALPLHVPEVYQVHARIVDPEGYVHLNRIRYSVPYALIGRQLEVRETLSQVEIYLGP